MARKRRKGTQKHGRAKKYPRNDILASASREAEASNFMSVLRKGIVEKIDEIPLGIHMHRNMDFSEISRRVKNNRLRAFVRNNKFEWNTTNRTRFVGAPHSALTQRDVMNLESYEDAKRSGLDPGKYQGYIPVYNLEDQNHGPSLTSVGGHYTMIILVASERVISGGDGTKPLEPGFVYDSTGINPNKVTKEWRDKHVMERFKAKLSPVEYYRGSEYTIVSLAEIPHIMFVTSSYYRNPIKDLFLFSYIQPHDKSQLSNVAETIEALGIANPRSNANLLVKHRFGKYDKTRTLLGESAKQRLKNIMRDARRLVFIILAYQKRADQKGRGVFAELEGTPSNSTGGGRATPTHGYRAFVTAVYPLFLHLPNRDRFSAIAAEWRRLKGR